MKSVVIQQPNALEIEERPLPLPGAGDVRVKIKLAGICGSDSHIYRGHNPFAKYPRVIGHEFFGEIDAVGVCRVRRHAHEDEGIVTRHRHGMRIGMFRRARRPGPPP